MRRTSLLAISVAVALAGVPAVARAATRTVSSTSSLVSAVGSANPGDVIVISGGTYSVNLVITRDGTSSSPITLRAATGATVILRAADDSRRVIQLDDASHWRIQGLRLRGSRHAILRIEGGTDNVIRDCEIYDGTKKGIIANGDRITIEGCTIRDIKQPRGGHDTQGIAIWRGSRIRIRDNRITTPGDGVLLGGAGALGVTPTDIRIYRNHFHTLDSWYSRYNIENAIDIKDGEDIVVTDNVIHGYKARQSDAGVAINVHTIDEEQDDDHLDSIRIERNTIYDVARGISVIERTGPTSGLLIRRNTFYNVLREHASSSKGPGAIFAGAWGDGFEIDHNTFVDVDGYVLHNYDDVDGLTFRNNIVRRSDGIKLASRAVVDYTCRYSSDSTGGAHDVVGNQRFVDDADRDYHLLSTSPCIDRGTLSVGLPYKGSRPDMGRYEHTPGDPLMPDEEEEPTPLPRDGRAIDWAATPGPSGPDELGPEIAEETPAGDTRALEEEPSPAPRADREEEEPEGAPEPARAIAATVPSAPPPSTADVTAEPAEPAEAPRPAARPRRTRSLMRTVALVGFSSVVVLGWLLVRRRPAR